jgi:muramoyltetrapeptide carboxypeptidase LdcA involved in peptidoglycan recycling
MLDAKEMQTPPKLKAGDEVRVLALSRTLGAAVQQAGFTEEDIAFASRRLEGMGLRVSLGRHVWECNEHLTTSPAHRLADLHEAVASASVKAILAVSGGMGASQILDGIDYEQFKAHPKIVCGYSDIAHVCNAILKRTGVVTYYGPNFTSFMMRQGAEYMLEGFRRCLFENSPIEIRPADKWSDDAWPKDQGNRTFHEAEGFWAIQDGAAEGTIVGGSYFCLNMLQGTGFFPSLREAILFLEHPASGKATLMELDSGLRSLSFLPEFPEVRAIVFGRYAKSAGVTREKLATLVGDIPALRHLPVIGNCDFGHTTPVLTFPIGGRCKLQVSQGKTSITFTEH